MKKPSMDMNRRDAGVAFLRNYFDLACYTHRVASKALYLRFNRARNAKLRKILITELFEEYASAFETLASWCRSLQERDQRDFLSYFITYNPRKAESFYREVEGSRGGFDFRSFARLPSDETLRQRSSDPSLVEDCNRDLQILNKDLREAASVYATDGTFTPAIFKKLKHSCVFVDEPTIHQSYVGNPPGMAPEWNAGEHVSVVTGPKPSSILILEANAHFALKLYQSTRQLSKLTRGVLALAIGLADRGLLFVYN